jgi:glycosyltransferase involved in cell wall biosynthesis
MSGSVIYLQNRTHRAGAQTCLARLLCHGGLREWAPVLLCGCPGWLADRVAAAGVRVVRQPFPASRSLPSRLFGNRLFARRVAAALAAQGIRPALIHANDHWEGLLGLAFARQCQVPAVIFLRSPGMTQADYAKYRCGDYDLVLTVGEELRQRAQAWEAHKTIHLVSDGIDRAEFAAPKPWPDAFPSRVLVIGSPLDWKGWADFTAALAILEKAAEWPAWQCDFTGDQPDPARNNLHLEALQRTQCRFLGRVEKFHDLVRGYDLVINPSRMESFGMASVETVAAGVPLLSSRVGVIEQVIRQPEFLFAPHQPASLVAALRTLRQKWPLVSFAAADARERIETCFLVDHAVGKLRQLYGQTTA